MATGEGLHKGRRISCPIHLGMYMCSCERLSGLMHRVLICALGRHAETVLNKNSLKDEIGRVGAIRIHPFFTNVH